MDMDRGHRFRNWSGMPSELLENIILKIGRLEDVTRFSCVCKEWLSVFRQVRPMLSPANPWLLLPENTQDNREGMRKVYNPGNKKYYNFKIPETLGKKCWGSNLGWIVTCGGDLEFNLFNPLTKNRLHLPPGKTMIPEQVYIDRSCDPKYSILNLTTARQILKVRVLKTKGGTEDAGGFGFVVAVIHIKKCRHRIYTFDDSTDLSIARPGDTTWTLIETPEEMIIEDVLCWKNMLCFFTKYCSLWYADLSETGPSLKAVKLIVVPHQMLFSDQVSTYLVESFTQELLLVQWCCEETTTKRSRNDIMISKGCGYFCGVHEEQNTEKKPAPASTPDCFIYKLDWSSKKWELVDNATAMGESSMFLSKDNEALMVGPFKHGKCKSKCIYSAGDDVVEQNGHHMNIYSVGSTSKTSKYEAVYHPADTKPNSSCKSSWFTPLL